MQAEEHASPNCIQKRLPTTTCQVSNEVNRINVSAQRVVIASTVRNAVIIGIAQITPAGEHVIDHIDDIVHVDVAAAVHIGRLQRIWCRASGEHVIDHEDDIIDVEDVASVGVTAKIR